MRRLLAGLGSLVFFFLAPGVVAGLVPWWITRWELRAPLFGIPGVRVPGAVLTLLALAVLLECFARFALQGRGTPAPPFPTQRLVIRGMYRYVRNPMYLAVVFLILGQGLLFGSGRVLFYGLAAWAVTHVFVLAYEEPTLRRTYGADYEAYCARVHRWLPRWPARAAGPRQS